MYTNLQQFEEEKDRLFVQSFQEMINGEPYDAFDKVVRPSDVRRFLRTAIRQAAELTVQELGKPFSAFTDPNDNIASRAKSWLSNEQPQ